MTPPIIYTLKRPVDIETTSGNVIEKIAELEIARPTGRHMKAMDDAKGEIGKLLALIAACSSQPVPYIERLDAEDIVALGEVFAGFLGQPLLTGAKSSPT